jgi:hypothetical protein
MKRTFKAASAYLCLGGLAAAFAVTALPDTASAQTRAAEASRRNQKAAPAQAAGPNLTRGAAEAPAALQATGVRCTTTAAAFLGQAGARNAYEVACSEGLGYILLVPPAAGGAEPAQAIDCLTAQTVAKRDQAEGRPAGAQCTLPANANPVQAFQAVAREAGVNCTVTNARAVGRVGNGAVIRYEAACSEGPGYVFDRPENAGGRATAQPCFRAEGVGGRFRCELTPRAQNLAVLQPLIRSAGRTCTVSDARLAGVNTATKNEVIEVGCQGAPGFFIETAPTTGAFVRAVNCGQLGSNPCQFTAAAVAQERNAQDYGQLLKAAGFDCTVSQFNRTGRETNGREVIEAACSNRPDGVYALLAPQGATARSEVMDCLLAAMTFRHDCTLTPVSALHPAITRTLPSQRIGRDCTVTGTRVMGRTPQGENWVEIGCSNGRSYVIDYRGGGRIARIVACGQAVEILGGCKRNFPNSRPAVGGES